jgi:segregation and condensation protein B
VSRKRRKTPKAAPEAVPDDVLAEGSGPVRRADVDAVTTVEDVVTTDDIETTDDVVTPDDVVGTVTAEGDPASNDSPKTARRTSAEPPASSNRRKRGRVTSAKRPASAAAEAESQTGDISDPEPRDEGDATVPRDEGDATELRDEGGATELRDEGDASEDGTFASATDDAGAAEGEGEGEGEGNGAAEGDGDDDIGVVFPTSAATMDAVQFKHLVEALIFASDRPLTVQRLRQLTRVGDVRRIEQALTEIAADYVERGVVLQQVSGGYQFRTRTQFSIWVQQLIAGRPVRLSRAQLETLAIIAYRQPITRPEIDDIRGVDSSATLKLLIDRMLIRVLGKREEVGRPMLYGTTKEFLDFFSLGDLRELPTLREYSELTAESRKVMSDRLGVAADGSDIGGGGDGTGGNGTGGDGTGGDGSGGGGTGSDGGGSGGDGSGSGGSGNDSGGDPDGGGGGFGGPDGFGGGGFGDGGLGGGSISDDGAHASASMDPGPGISSSPTAASMDDSAYDPAPAHDPLSDAVAAFLSAADAVERSNTAALAESDLDDDLHEATE